MKTTRRTFTDPLEATIEMRRPDFSQALRQPSGRVVRDDLGNAVWNWSQRGRATAENLVGAVLTVAEHPEEARKREAAPQLGGGYNPYGVGPREPRAGHTQRDLRTLSQGIEATRRAHKAAALAASETAAYRMLNSETE
jgi:hypothetical protein